MCRTAKAVRRDLFWKTPQTIGSVPQKNCLRFEIFLFTKREVSTMCVQFFVNIVDKKSSQAIKIAHYMEIYAFHTFLARKHLHNPHKMY